MPTLTSSVRWTTVTSTPTPVSLLTLNHPIPPSLARSLANVLTKKNEPQILSRTLAAAGRLLSNTRHFEVQAVRKDYTGSHRPEQLLRWPAKIPRSNIARGNKAIVSRSDWNGRRLVCTRFRKRNALQTPRILPVACVSPRRFVYLCVIDWLTAPKRRCANRQGNLDPRKDFVKFNSKRGIVQLWEMKLKSPLITTVTC